MSVVVMGPVVTARVVEVTARGVGALVAAAGGAVLLTESAGLVPSSALGRVPATTAAGLVLCGLGLACATREGATRSASRLLGVAALLLSLAVLASHVQAAAATRSAGPDAIAPRRDVMAAASALDLALLGVSVAALDVRTRTGLRPAQLVVLPAAAIGFIALLAHAYRVPALLQAPGGEVSVLGATGGLLLSLGLLAVRPETGLTARVLADDAGGVAFRRFLPLVLVGVPIAGFVSLGLHVGGIFGAEAATALLVGCVLTASLIALASTASALRRLDERRRSAEAGRQRAIAELERSNAALEDFAIVASHDMQEPLRKIVSFGEMLQAHVGADSPEEARDALRRMTDAAQRMRRLVEDVLDYARLAARPFPRRPTPLADVVSEALSDLDLRVDGGEARVDVGPLPVVPIDRAQVRRLFVNLVGNALKFTRPGTTPVVKVRATRDEAARAWHVDVSDEGIGFPEADAERIFEPLQRLHARSRYPGSGMGLAICRRIVERHGGRIGAKSRPGGGATFRVTFPTEVHGGREGGATP